MRWVSGGASLTMRANSAADFTITGVVTPSCAAIASATVVANAVVFGRGAVATALPLLSSVRTPVQPRRSSSDVNAAIGTRLPLPTLTPRSNTTKRGMAVGKGCDGAQCAATEYLLPTPCRRAKRPSQLCERTTDGHPR